MRLTPVPVIGILRELWLTPRDMARFHEYVRKIQSGPEGEIFAPLVAANPMAKRHMVGIADQLLAMGADSVLAENVRAMMRQEGMALRFAQAKGPPLADADAVRQALAPHLDSTLHATRLTGMYGDAAAARTGHAPLGLPDEAGITLAHLDAQAARETPEDLV